jgi:hypothetical protein
MIFETNNIQKLIDKNDSKDIMYIIINNDANLTENEIIRYAVDVGQLVIMQIGNFKCKYSSLNDHIPTMPQFVVDKLFKVEDWLEKSFKKQILKVSASNFFNIETLLKDKAVVSKNGQVVAIASYPTSEIPEVLKYLV